MASRARSLAKHVFVDIRMGIDMYQTDRPVNLRHGSQNRQTERVIATERQRDALVREDIADTRFNDLDTTRKVEGIDRQIAKICHLHGIKR